MKSGGAPWVVAGALFGVVLACNTPSPTTDAGADGPSTDARDASPDGAPNDATTTDAGDATAGDARNDAAQSDARDAVSSDVAALDTSIGDSTIVIPDECDRNEDCTAPNTFCAFFTGCSAGGFCTPTDICVTADGPVCGCDGTIYETDCEAFAARVSVDYGGDSCADK